MISPQDIKDNEQIKTYIRRADDTLSALGFTEHSFAHVTRVAHFAEKVLRELGYDDRTCELAWIAGYMHDIGNVINRIDHAQSGAVMAFRILDKLGMTADEIATVCSAIGNHGISRQSGGGGAHPRRQDRRAPHARAQPGHGDV